MINTTFVVFHGLISTINIQRYSYEESTNCLLCHHRWFCVGSDHANFRSRKIIRTFHGPVLQIDTAIVTGKVSPMLYGLMTGLSGNFTREFPPYSMRVLKVKTK